MPFFEPAALEQAAGRTRYVGAAQSWSPNWHPSQWDSPAPAGALYAGRSVGAVRGRQLAAEVVAELSAEAEQLLAP
jgi:hypothetical protein